MLLRESDDLVARRSVRLQSDADVDQEELSLRVATVTSSPDDDQQQRSHEEEDDDENDKGKRGKPATARTAPSDSGAAPAKILFLDGVRGVATVLVVAQHANYLFGVNIGQCAVDIFFVLSSFLLTWLFYKKSEQLIAQQATLRKWGFALADYFSKRFFRVYPLFAAVAIFVWLLPYASQHRYWNVQRPGDYQLFKVLTSEFKYRFHVFWTLPLEIAYYFLIPLVVVTAINLGKGWWVPTAPLYYWIWTQGWNAFRGDHQPMAMHLPTFICGSLGAIIYVKIDAAIKHNAFEFKRWQVLVVRLVEFVTFWLLLSVCCRALFFHWFFDHPKQVEGGARFISLHVTLLIIIEMVLPSALSTALEWSPLRYWGKIGFSIYLLHSFVIYAEPIRSQKNYYDKLFSQFFLITVLGAVSFHLVEVPCQKMSSRISRALAQMEKQGAVSTASAYKPVPVTVDDANSAQKIPSATWEGSLLPVSVRQ